MAPDREKWMEERSDPICLAVASNRWYMGGTPRKKVHGRRFWEVRIIAWSNLGNIAMVAPMRRPARKPIVKPKAWNRGRTQ